MRCSIQLDLIFTSTLDLMSRGQKDIYRQFGIPDRIITWSNNGFQMFFYSARHPAESEGDLL